MYVYVYLHDNLFRIASEIEYNFSDGMYVCMGMGVCIINHTPCVSYLHQPPFKGLMATMVGMTWARAAIFYGSEVGKSFLLEKDVYGPLAQTLPPLVIGVVVQAVR